MLIESGHEDVSNPVEALMHHSNPLPLHTGEPPFAPTTLYYLSSIGMLLYEKSPAFAGLSYLVYRLG